MTKYYVKSHFNGWCEVSKENYERFKNFVIEHSMPIFCTPNEMAEKLTKIVEE